MEDGRKLTRYLKARHPPTEEDELFRRKRQYEKDVRAELNVVNLKDFEAENAKKMRKQINDRVRTLLKQRVYSWSAMNYDKYKALTYLIGRSAQEYATITRIFMEIQQRDPEFKPRSFFDFGAGVGTGTWAASSLWKDLIYEYFLVDSSREMNDLSELILRDGDPNKHLKLKDVYYRQFLPASSESKFSLVLSAYSLFELPSAKERLEVLMTLWNKCDGYLVIVEAGNKHGFELVNEARNFLLHLTGEDNSAHVFAPVSERLFV